MTRGEKLLVVFLVALAVRGIVFSLVAAHPQVVMQPDSRMYVSLAQGLTQHGTLCYPETPGVPDAERMPGYPFFIALIMKLFGANPLAVVVVQLVLDSLSCLLVYSIGERIYKNAGFLSGILASLHLGMITYAHFILNETLTLFVFLVSVVLLLGLLKKPSWKTAALVGGWVGVGALIRPAMSYLPLVLMPFVFLCLVPRTRLSLSRAAIISASIGVVFALVVLPWVARNHMNYNRFSLTSQGGDHLLLYVVPFVWQNSKGIPFIEGMKQVNDLLKQRAKDAGVDLVSMNPFERSDFEVGLAMECLRKEPKASIAKAWVSGMIKNLFAPALVDFSYLLNIERPHFSFVEGSGLLEQAWNFFRGMQGVFQWALLLSLLVTAAARVVQVGGIMVALRGRSEEVILFIVLIAYFLVISGPVGYAKYRLPFEPILTVFLAVGLTYLFSKWSKSAGRGRIRIGSMNRPWY